MLWTAPPPALAERLLSMLVISDVVDAGFFVSSNAVNPTLTTVANALRVGDHLLDRMNV